MDELFQNIPITDSIPPKSGKMFRRTMSLKQAKLVGWLVTHAPDHLSLAEAVRLVGGNVYHNAEKHTGALMANMVRRGMLVRVKPGLFKLP